MDFGLDRVLEMFEQDFGPRLTKLVIGLLGLAVVAVAVHTIWRFIVVPLYDLVLAIIQTGIFHFIETEVESITKGQIISSAILFVLLALISWLYFQLLHIVTMRRIKRVIASDPIRIANMVTKAIQDAIAIIENAKDSPTESPPVPAPQGSPAETSQLSSPG